MTAREQTYMATLQELWLEVSFLIGTEQITPSPELVDKLEECQRLNRERCQAVH